MDTLYWALAAGAFSAGFIDAVAGGGGLIQVPALLMAFPQALPSTVFGTNKCASLWGTLTAARQYLMRVALPRRVVVGSLGSALIGAWLGASLIARIPVAILRPGVLLLLIVVAVYTFTRHELGRVHAPRHGLRAELLISAGIAGALGFYDGVFGPGTGAFLIFLFVRVLGYDFLHASALGKLVNSASNFGALGYFVPAGHILWVVAAMMALCNVAGALIGTHLALRHGSGFVRVVFMLVVAALIVRLAQQSFSIE
ncbi:MAG: sulfite exporter TauE/SafE family protein [Gammaproteobacteria bacterium]